LQITHSQWIYRNISLHNKQQGYLHHKRAEEFHSEILELSDLTPYKVPKTSRFLLEISFTELTNASLKTQSYWTLAVNAALNTQHREATRCPRVKHFCKKLNQNIPSRKKLGVVALEQQIRADGVHTHSSQGTQASNKDHTQATLAHFINKHSHPSNAVNTLKSNKHLRKPD
jgi:hypothetical protein